MIYIAHRGAPVLARENSLPSFELALKAGLNWFELDVHLSKDGQLIVHHDYAFTRTAGDNREIGGLTLEEIKKINICKGTDQPFCSAPTVEQVFGVLPETVTVNVEIKNEQGRYLGIEQAVAAFAKTHRPERIAVSNQTYPSLIKMREIAPELRLGLLADESDFDDALKTALAIRAESINMSVKRCTPAMASKTHEAGMKVLLYTIRTAKDLAQAASVGADGVFTDDPYLKL